MSMYALSKRSGISQSSLSNLMKRGSTPSFFTLDKICDGLGITLAQFFSDEHEILDLTEEQKKVLQARDVEIIMDGMMRITYHLCMKMFDYGAFFADQY